MILVISSLFLSLLIYGVYGYFTGISDLDMIRDTILLPQNLLAILSCSLLMGAVPGLILRLFFRGGIVRGDAWQVSMNMASKKGSWIIVYTKDSREYKGILHYSGAKDFAKEVSIRRPKRIFRDSEGNLLEEVNVGKEILFSEKDIARIAFFKEV